MLPRGVLLALLLGLLPCGCVQLSYVGKAEVAYDDGRYFEVAESLANEENDMRTLPAYKRARYGVYRGLALLRLGDYEGADRWLRYARDVDAQAHTLDARQRKRLAEGLSELARQRKTGRQPSPQDETGGAASSNAAGIR